MHTNYCFLLKFSLNYWAICGYFFCSDIMCLSMDPDIKMNNFIEEIKDIFKFREEQSFTMKWLDEEGRFSRKKPLL